MNGPHFNDEAGGGAAPRLRLLVVDAHADGADSLTMLLRVFGYEVRTAYTGPAGLELARTYQPDVVISSLHLPGLDGYQLAKRLRQEVASATLVALTGDGQPSDRARTKEAGFTYHLLKPASLDEFQEILMREAKRRQALPSS